MPADRSRIKESANMPFASIYNRNERAVFDKVREASARFPELAGDEDLLADASCIALNALPAHYVRHAVDLSFHISDTQREEDAKAVSVAVESALRLVRSRRLASHR
jgi:hypothetical protein